MEAPELLVQAVQADDVDELQKHAPGETLQGWRDGDGRTLLHHAAASGATAGCGFLISCGIAPRLTDAAGRTALHYAAERGDEDMCLMLIENGVAADTADLRGQTPYDCATRMGFDDCARLLRMWRSFARSAADLDELWGSPAISHLTPVPENSTVADMQPAEPPEQQWADEMPRIAKDQRRRIYAWLQRGASSGCIADIEQVDKAVVEFMKSEMVDSKSMQAAAEKADKGLLLPPEQPELARATTSNMDPGKKRAMVRMLQRRVVLREIATVCSLQVEEVLDFVRLHRWTREDVTGIVSGILEEPDEFTCPICYEIMVDPVLAADGFVYERKSMERVLQTIPLKSPKTNLPLPNANLVPAVFWRAQIFNFLEGVVKSAALLVPRIVEQGFLTEACRLCERAAFYVETLGGSAKFQEIYGTLVLCWCQAVLGNMQEADHDTSLPNELLAAVFGLPHSVRINISSKVCIRECTLTSVHGQLRDILLNPKVPVAKRPLHDLERLQLDAARSPFPKDYKIWIGMLELDA